MTPEDLAAWIAASRRTETNLELEKVSDEWLNTAPAKFQISLTYSIKEPDTALQIAEDLTYQYSGNPIYLAHHAYLAYRIREFSSSLTKIEKALEIWPDEPHWHILAANLETEKKNHSKAIDHLEKACCIDDELSDLHFQLGNAYLNGGLPGNAIRVLENAVSAQPLKPPFWSKLAQAYQATGELEQASSSIEKAVNLAPDVVKYRLLAAEIAAAEGLSIKSDQFIQQALDLQPRESEDVIHLTNLLVQLGKPEEALQRLDELLDLSLSPVPLMLQKAAILRETSGVKEEIKILVQLIKQAPKNALVLSRLCSAYIKVNQLQDAIKAGQFAIKHAGTTLSSNQVSKLNYQVGMLFQRSGQLDQALSHLAKSIELTPHYVDAYLEISKTLQARREISKAINYLDQAILIAPDDPRPYLHTGILLKESKDYLGAEAMLKKAAALAPDDVNIKRQLAAIIAMAIIHQNETL
jgi:tetratricopeptide (TPR) repeat protein